jgi:hypothetical protein
MSSDRTAPAETNKEKLLRHLRSVLDDAQAYLEETDEERREERQEALQPLCVMKRIEVNVQLAWGGPSYGFKLLRDPESKEFDSGVFYYADWFTYDECDLSRQELETVIEAFDLTWFE